MKKTVMMMAMTIVAIVTLSSFNSKFGGEGFEIYLNNKVVAQKFGKDMSSAFTLSLDNALPNDILMVKYHRCGNYTNRSFEIRDNNSKVLLKLTASNVTEQISTTKCYVKDILGVKKPNSSLNLFFVSNEMPNGRQLAMIESGKNAVAAK